MKLAANTFALLLLCAAPALAGPLTIADQGLAPASTSRVGEKLLVLWQGAYWPAAVIGDQGHGRVRIHYDGYGPEWDETITSERIRHEVARAAPEVGRSLYVGWGGALWPAKIVHAAHGRYTIHYLGWGDEWDEVVGPERLHWLGSLCERERAPCRRSGLDGERSAHVFQRGEQVDIEWQGSYWPGIITRVAADRYSVHYDGYGPEWDETVGEIRLRPR